MDVMAEPRVTALVLLTYGRDEDCFASLHVRYPPPVWDPEDVLHEWDGVPQVETRSSEASTEDETVRVNAVWLSSQTGIPVEDLPGSRLVWTREGWRPE